MEEIQRKITSNCIKLTGMYMDLEGASLDEAIKGVLDFINRQLEAEIDWVGEMLCK